MSCHILKFCLSQDVCVCIFLHVDYSSNHFESLFALFVMEFVVTDIREFTLVLTRLTWHVATLSCLSKDM